MNSDSMEDTKQEGVVRMTNQITAEPSAQQGPYGFRILLALQAKPIYQGTKSQFKAKKRAVRLRGKAARKVNRRG